MEREKKRETERQKDRDKERRSEKREGRVQPQPANRSPCDQDWEEGWGSLGNPGPSEILLPSIPSSGAGPSFSLFLLIDINKYIQLIDCLSSFIFIGKRAENSLHTPPQSLPNVLH